MTPRRPAMACRRAAHIATSFPCASVVVAKMSASLTFGNAVVGQRVAAKAEKRVSGARATLRVENRVTIRFTRIGRKKDPFYRIIAIDSRSRRDGMPIAQLGWYDPIAKQSSLDAPAIKEWISKGALPSDTVGALLKKALIM